MSDELNSVPAAMDANANQGAAQVQAPADIANGAGQDAGTAGVLGQTGQLLDTAEPEHAADPQTPEAEASIRTVDHNGRQIA